jgi:hypothetical protein
MNVREVFTHKRMTASGAIFSGIGALGGFLCTTAGTLVIKEGTDGTGSEVVSSLTLTAGQWVPLPFAFAGGAHATLGGGCIGTFAVGQ